MHHLFLATLEQQRRHQHRVGRIAGVDLPVELTADGRVGDRLQIAARLLVAEHDIAQRAAVQAAVVLQHRAEPVDDSVQRRLARRHHRPRRQVRIDNGHAAPRQMIGGRGLTAADTAGQADNKHRDSAI